MDLSPQTTQTIEQFIVLLKKLSASKKRIHKATKFAMTNVIKSDVIFQVIMKRLRKVSDERRTPIFYLIDSLCQVSKKKEDLTYINLVHTNLIKIIALIKDELSLLEKVFRVWEERQIFPTDFLNNIRDSVFYGRPLPRSPVLSNQGTTLKTDERNPSPDLALSIDTNGSATTIIGTEGTENRSPTKAQINQTSPNGGSHENQKQTGALELTPSKEVIWKTLPFSSERDIEPLSPHLSSETRTEDHTKDENRTSERTKDRHRTRKDEDHSDAPGSSSSRSSSLTKRDLTPTSISSSRRDSLPSSSSSKRDSDRDRDRERDRDKERPRDRERDKERNKEKDRENNISRVPERDRRDDRVDLNKKDRDKDRDRERDHERNRDREKDKDREKEREKERERERERETRDRPKRTRENGVEENSTSKRAFTEDTRSLRSTREDRPNNHNNTPSRSHEKHDRGRSDRDRKRDREREDEYDHEQDYEEMGETKPHPRRKFTEERTRLSI